MAYIVSWEGSAYRGAPAALKGHFLWEEPIAGVYDVSQIERYISKTFGPAADSVIILNIFKLEDQPAEVRMSAESLMQLQRVAAARAVTAFAATLTAGGRKSAEQVKAEARTFADAILNGEIKQW